MFAHSYSKAIITLWANDLKAVYISVLRWLQKQDDDEGKSRTAAC